MVCACCKQRAAAADGTIASLLGVIVGVCVRCMFGKTSLALVCINFINGCVYMLHCKRCISYSNSVRPSVRLSVRPSHAGIVSKHVARCSLHRWIAKCV